jgi:hypothetical protein
MRIALDQSMATSTTTLMALKESSHNQPSVVLGEDFLVLPAAPSPGRLFFFAVPN